MVIDDEGNKVSPLELKPYIPHEDEEIVKDEIQQARDFSKREYSVLDQNRED